MANSELIKNLSHIRDYMRNFYVYAFKTRSDFDSKSLRSYDNERHRIECWLEKYMHKERGTNGERVFLSVDSRAIEHNPLYEAFRAKSFTRNDLIFHFYVLDLLSDGSELTSTEILNAMEERYMYIAPKREALDESTVRKKLKEYVNEGLLYSKKRGVKTVYFRKDDEYDAESWKDCISFFSEVSPLGVIGSFMQKADAYTPFRFKHHYILSALDSEIFYTLALAIKDKKRVGIKKLSRRSKETIECNICPAYFYISTQTGRQYVLATQTNSDRPMFYRLDLIKTANIIEDEPAYDELKLKCDEYRRHIWGVSQGEEGKLQHLTMRINVGYDEEYIVRRLQREKRSGEVLRLDETTWQFSADICDARELMPWVRTFIGRIISLDCTDETFMKDYRNDLRKLAALYGGDTDAV